MRTAEFVGIRTFGTTSEVEAAAGGCGASTPSCAATTRSRDGHSGSTTRRACCGCTAERSTPTSTWRSAPDPNDADADRYIAESARAAEVVGAADAPRSRAEMKAYFDEIRPRLRLTDEAITGTTNLMTARMPAPVVGEADAAAHRGAGVREHARWARRMYGSPGLPTTDLSTTLALKALRATLTRIPGPPEPPHMQRARRLMVEAARCPRQPLARVRGFVSAVPVRRA